MIDSELVRLFTELRGLFVERGAMVEQHLGSKHNQKDHGHGNGGGVAEAREKVKERAESLGYSNVTFKETKGGRLQVWASGPKGGKQQKQKIFIEPDGRITHEAGGKKYDKTSDYVGKK